MNRLKNFNIFLEDLILEKINSNELPLVLSERLRDLLRSIKHPICDKLLNDYVNEKLTDVTLIDYDDNNIDMFTFANSPKIFDLCVNKTLTDDSETNINKFRILSRTNDIWNVNRTSIKIGKLINKIYPNQFLPSGEPGKDLETFVELIKSERSKEEGSFKIVNGDDIMKYYLLTSYESDGEGSTLYGSCMKYEGCQDYISFYSNNKKSVSLVVLMSDTEKDKIIGRALLWNLDEVDGKKTGRKYLDRIYTIKSHDVSKFKNLAKKNGWYYKRDQDMWEDTEITDSKDGSSSLRILIVKNIKENKAYPYMDTLKYFDINNNTLSNKKQYGKYIFKLESVDGGYYTNGAEFMYYADYDQMININEMFWSDTEDKYIYLEDSVHSNYVDDNVTKEYADDFWTYSELMKDWIPNDHVEWIKYLNDYVSEEYAEENFVRSTYDDNWYNRDMSLPSEKWECVPESKLVRVYLNDHLELSELDNIYESDFDIDDDVDNRWKNDGTYFTIYIPYLDKYYNFDKSLINSPILRPYLNTKKEE